MEARSGDSSPMLMHEIHQLRLLQTQVLRKPGHSLTCPCDPTNSPLLKPCRLAFAITVTYVNKSRVTQIESVILMDSIILDIIALDERTRVYLSCPSFLPEIQKIVLELDDCYSKEALISWHTFSEHEKRDHYEISVRCCVGV
jgi:hypothetical protein